LKFKKPYKGFKEIKKPNSKKCWHCEKDNCDWGRSDEDIQEQIKWFEGATSLEVELIKGFLSVRGTNTDKFNAKNSREWKKSLNNDAFHKICVFKSRHYGIHPDKWNAWQKENKIAVEKTKKRDNYECQLCFGEVKKHYIPVLKSKISLFEQNISDGVEMKSILGVLNKERKLEYTRKLLEKTEKEKLNVHHIMKVQNGGSNDSRNLITICSHCHNIIERRVDDEKKLNIDKKNVNLTINPIWIKKLGISLELFNKIHERYNDFKKSHLPS